MSEFFLGIDLGTTNTLACYLKNGTPKILTFTNGAEMLASVLYMDESGKLHVGQAAKNMAIVDPLHGIRSAKRDMGNFEKKWTLGEQEFTPTDVATEILKVVYKTAWKKLKCMEGDVINAVITVPAYFNSNQTDETKKAGMAAGFQVRQIITEPMAAAVAAVRQLVLDKKVFVVDLGGGTFDLSVLEADQASHIYRTLGIDGDSKLGGDDFDDALYNYLVELIENDLGMDLSSQEASGLEYNEYYSMTGRVRGEAEKAKISLSESESTTVDIINLFTYNGKGYDFNAEITRDIFDEKCQPLYKKILDRIRRFVASDSSKFSLDDIGEIILAGGSCYIPKVSRGVMEIFDKKANTEINLSTLVVEGACFVAESINGGVQIKPQDILSHSLGVEVKNDSNELVLSKILEKGDAYPCEKTRVYTTTRDNQTSIPVNVYEAGSDNEELPAIDRHDLYGSLVLEGIEPAPRGTTSIEVTFSYDSSRVLTVTAEDAKTGIKKQVQIKKGEKVTSNAGSGEVANVMLLLDTSGSMCGAALKTAKKACVALFSDMIDLSQHSAGLISFDSNATKLSPLTHDTEELLGKLKGMRADGATYLKNALTMAYSDLQKANGSKIILVVTDGEAHDEEEALEYAKSLKENNIRIIAIGVGSGISKDFLAQFVSDGDLYTISNMDALRDTFARVMETIAEMSR